MVTASLSTYTQPGEDFFLAKARHDKINRNFQIVENEKKVDYILIVKLNRHDLESFQLH